jgi:hypothetical protein
MKLVLTSTVGRRGFEKIIYKLLDVLIGQVIGKIVIPHNNKCSNSLKIRIANSPSIVGNRIVIICLDRNRKWVQNVYNITWRRGDGVLSGGYLLPEKCKSILLTNGADIFCLSLAHNMFLYRYPYCKYNNFHDYQRQLIHNNGLARYVYCLFATSGNILCVLTNKYLKFNKIQIMNIRCTAPVLDSLRPRNEQIYDDVVVIFTCRHECYNSHNKPLLYMNGNYVSPVKQTEKKGKSLRKNTVEYCDVYSPLKVSRE